MSLVIERSFVIERSLVIKRSLGAGALLAVVLGGSASAGTTGGEQGPVQVSSATPAGVPPPSLGTGTAAGVTVGGVGLQGRGTGIAVLASVTTTRPDRLVSIASNYTRPVVLAQPLTVTPGPPTLVDPATTVLPKAGTIDDGATVSVVFTFATAGAVQVYATYRA